MKGIIFIDNPFCYQGQIIKQGVNMSTGGLENFLRKVPGSKYELFDVDGQIIQSGDLSELTGIDVIVKSLSRLLLIPKGTYIHDPEIGTNLYKYIFEPVDERTKTSIEQVVAQAIARYENRAKINFDILFFSNRKGFRIDLFIDYHGEKKNVSINVDESMLKTLS